MALTREQFEAMRPTIEQVSNLDGEVTYIRTLSARERDDYDASIDNGERRNLVNLSARLVCRCLCDEEGVLLFPDPADGEAAIGVCPTPIIEPLFHACRKLNGMGKHAVEQAAKNSAPGQTDSSNTD